MLRLPRDAPRLFRRIIQTINNTMKKFIIPLAALALLFACTPVDDKSGTDGNDNNNKQYSAVDLGLSVKWASCNIGANAPEEYGDYYAWGETETKENYEWQTYKWYDGSARLTKYNTDTSYGTVDNKTVLDLEDDVAHVKLGGSWRMPTYSEVDELMSTRYDSSYKWEWRSLNGHNGWLVTCLVNGNSIFLPAAGNRYDTYCDVGSRGDYWSSSLDGTNYPDHAWRFYFTSDYVDDEYGGVRNHGFSVRPVFSE